MKDLTISIPTIHCTSCVANIKKETAKLQSCDIEVSFPLKKAAVSFDESKTSEKEIVDAIARAGYQSEIIEE